MTRTAVVVGVGGGLGTAIFERLATSGTPTIICSGHPETTEPLASDLREAGDDALSFACDPSDPIDIAEGFAEALAVFDTIDVVVFTAGATASGGSVGLGRSAFLDALHRDVLGGFCTARAVVPRMQTWGTGTLVFVGSATAHEGAGGRVGPSSTHPGLRGLAASIREEVADEIAVSHVAVGDGAEMERVAAEVVDLLEEEIEDEYRLGGRDE